MARWHTTSGGNPEANNSKKMTISFEIPSREDQGTMIQIVATGKESPIQMTYERSAMEACLLGLERHGF